MDFFPSSIQTLQYLDKYSHYDHYEGVRENWPQTVDRTISWLRRSVPAVEDVPWFELRQAILKQQIMPSMRILQMAGPALDRCHVGAYNCAFLPLKDVFSFAELLYILMQGTGVGFSVEYRHTSKLPTIKKQRYMKTPHIVVLEDTTEAWCDALIIGMNHWFDGLDCAFDFEEVRKAGSLLLTKGGVSSGPEPLWELLTFVRKTILGAQGGKLTSLECHDIACMCAWIVQVGGVRRAATLSLFDEGDPLMREAKSGNYPFMRAMANNSIVYEQKPSFELFESDFRVLQTSGSGEPGIFNRGDLKTQIPARRKFHPDMGCNPCGEIFLRPFEFCNLTQVIARKGDTFEDLSNKVRLATILGTVQSNLTRFSYIRKDWKANCEEERLLGVDITGQADCDLLQHGKKKSRSGIFGPLRQLAYNTNLKWAAKFEISPSVAITCVKPSGNSSQLLDCSSGLHPRFAKYYLRRLRMGSETPISKLLIDSGMKPSPEVGHDPDNPRVWVFEFPVASPEGSKLCSDMDVLDQLDNWYELKKFWTDHNPSCTIYVRPEEWPYVKQWLWNHWEDIGGLTFMPKSEHIYDLAPYLEISRGQYELALENLPNIDFSKISGSNYTQTREYSCTSGACEL